jgi:hypothetical protein
MLMSGISVFVMGFLFGLGLELSASIFLRLCLCLRLRSWNLCIAIGLSDWVCERDRRLLDQHCLGSFYHFCF